MKCPDCNQTLKSNTYLGVKIDECDNCGGKWFDHDELKAAIDSRDNYLRWLDFNVFEEVKDKYISVESGKLCPKCRLNLTSKTYSESKVIIGVCPKCGGVWLDKNEFQKIIKYLEKTVLNQPAEGYARETVKQFAQIFTGPQNRISEIKDFVAVAKLFEMRLSIENPWIPQLSKAVNTVGLSLGI